MTNCDLASLEAALARGGSVHLACPGTLVVTHDLIITNAVVLAATAPNVILAASPFVGFFQVRAGGELTLSNLTLRDGLRERGGAIFNEGRVTLQNCVFRSNRGMGGRGRDAVFAANLPGAPGEPGRDGSGGAIYNTGSMTVRDCWFFENRAEGGLGGSGAAGGQVDPLLATGWPGGVGGTGGRAFGGVIFNAGELSMFNSTFDHNAAAGGLGGGGGGGGGNRTAGHGGNGGPGGESYGGAICNAGQLVSVNCTFYQGMAIGGSGGPGGPGGTGRFLTEDNGGMGGDAGGASGGGVLNLSGTATFTNCTVAVNEARGGIGGLGGIEPGTFEGVFFVRGTRRGDPGRNGSGAGGNLANPSGSMALFSSIVADTPSGQNVAGTVTDLGNNLSSDLSAHFEAAGSSNNRDLKLGALVFQGGVTPTVPLLEGSPAIDAVKVGACPGTDQRGFPRPGGAACDAGAFEGAISLPQAEVRITQSASNVFQLDLTVTNSNSEAVLNNLELNFFLPPGLILEPSGGSASNQYHIAVDAPLLAGQSKRTEVKGQAVKPGEYLVTVQTKSSSTGARFHTATIPVTIPGPPRIIAQFAGLFPAPGATLTALVVPNGQPATGWFEYGTSSNYGQRTMGVEIGDRFDPVLVSVQLPQLPTTGSYHYRTVVSNRQEVVYGGDRVLSPESVAISCSPAELENAVKRGGAIYLNCAGRVPISNTLVIEQDVLIRASGPAATIDGQQLGSIFSVKPGAQLTLIGLALENGRSSNGGAILNDGGQVQLIDCVFSNNVAFGTDGLPGVNALPGVTNRSGGIGDAGRAGLGGAIYNRGILYVTNTIFGANRAVGGRGGAGANAADPAGPLGPVEGGGSNPGGHGGGGGSGFGGAIFNDGVALLTRCGASNNVASGGQGGAAGFNYVIFPTDISATISTNAAPGGTGGESRGGFIYHQAGELYLLGMSMNHNTATGGLGGDGVAGTSFYAAAGGIGGAASGGAIFNGAEARIEHSFLGLNGAKGGAGGAGSRDRGNGLGGGSGGVGGNAQGGAVDNEGSILLRNDTVLGNQALGGAGGTGGDSRGPGGVGGSARGGGLSNQDGNTDLIEATFAQNRLAGGPGAPGGPGHLNNIGVPLPPGSEGTNGLLAGGTIFKQGGVLRLANCIVEVDFSNTTPPLESIFDAGGNINSDERPLLLAYASRNHLDPSLGRLVNDSVTLWFELNPDSPAIDAGVSAFCSASDQRGVNRPIGQGCDSGALEFIPSPRVSESDTGQLLFEFILNPDRVFQVESTADFLNWRMESTVQANSVGVVRFGATANTPHRFYRLRF